MPESADRRRLQAAPYGERLKLSLARYSTAIFWTSTAAILLALVLMMRALPAERILVIAQDRIGGMGMWGPLALGVLYVAAALLFVPGWMLTVAAGALYGVVRGTLIVSLASTTSAALAFLIARYVARDKMRSRVERSPKLVAIDDAIGEQGWKIVVLLRLSPAVPFNLQNYLYGVTAIRFWPCIIASWAAMLPGTFLYVYIGSLGRAAAPGHAATWLEWTLRAVGLLATVAVTVYVGRLARDAIQKQTRISGDAEERKRPNVDQKDSADARSQEANSVCWPWSNLAMITLAIALLVCAGWVMARPEAVRRVIEDMLGPPPSQVVLGDT